MYSLGDSNEVTVDSDLAQEPLTCPLWPLKYTSPSVMVTDILGSISYFLRSHR